MTPSLEALASEAARLSVPLSMVVKSELGRTVLEEIAGVHGLVLQGGGALHHVHGSPRYSADLDLVVGEGFDATALDAALERVAARASEAWGEVSVTAPVASGRLTRQKLRVVLRPGTALVLALERYAVAVHRPERRPLAGSPLVEVWVEAPEELMADKLVAAVDRWRSRGSVKLRDAYDLDFLSNLAAPDRGLVVRKLEDYGMPPDLGPLREVARLGLGELAAEDLTEQLRGVLSEAVLREVNEVALLGRVRALVLGLAG